MATEQHPKFEFAVDPDKLLDARLAEGELVEGSQLAELLREWGDQPLSEPFRSLLCDFLEGRIRKKRGRKTVPPLARLVETSEMRLIYRACWLVLRDYCKAAGKPPCREPAKNPNHKKLKKPECKSCKGPCETSIFVKEHRGHVNETLSKHEQAACYASIYLFGHTGHYRTILNRISSRKTDEL